jgi:hypothetical protein
MTPLNLKLVPFYYVPGIPPGNSTIKRGNEAKKETKSVSSLGINQKKNPNVIF